MYKPPHYGFTWLEHYQYWTLCYLFNAFGSLRHACERGGKAVGAWCFQQALKAHRGREALLERRDYRRSGDQYGSSWYPPFNRSIPPQNFWQLLKVMFHDERQATLQRLASQQLVIGPDNRIQGIRAVDAKNPLFNWLRFIGRKKHRGPAEVDWKAYADAEGPGYSLHKPDCPYEHGGACTCKPIGNFPYNPAHAIATCGSCGGEMIYNVPRLGPNGGYVHKATGSFSCPGSAGQMHVEISHTTPEPSLHG